MLFSSLIFVWFFLPIVFIGNYLKRKIGRHGGDVAENIFLLIASLFFMHGVSRFTCFDADVHFFELVSRDVSS